MDRAISLPATTSHRVYKVSIAELPRLQKIIEVWLQTCEITPRHRGRSIPPNYQQLTDCQWVLRALETHIEWKQCGRCRDATFLVCVNAQNEVISIAQTASDGTRQHVVHLSSSPEHLQHPERRSLKGGGTALIQAIEQIARTANITELAVDSVSSAEDFYCKQGFRREDSGLYIKLL